MDAIGLVSAISKRADRANALYYLAEGNKTSLACPRGVYTHGAMGDLRHNAWVRTLTSTQRWFETATTSKPGTFIKTELSLNRRTRWATGSSGSTATTTNYWRKRTAWVRLPNSATMRRVI
ncbi:hypothetical protein [Fibrella forsythiae]|uniref:hypothetical protein n=1 Tax=Fibrella forsythiae TaxID=2817061 RepID=UPI001E4A5FE0|nr:hypothetical protein [Fibrella forsythiae]